MEHSSFDLLWLPDPAKACLHDNGDLQLHEVQLTLHSDAGPADYFVHLDHCSECGQWYGLLPVLEEIRTDAELESEEITAFSIEGERVATGVHLGSPPMPWSSFSEQMSSMQAAQEQPTPTVEEVQALGVSPTTWEVGQGPAAWIGEEDEEAELSYLALVHGPNLIRSLDVSVGAPFDAEQLAALVRRAAGAPQPPSQPGRPRTIRLADETQAEALKPHLDPLDIEIEVHETPLVTNALDEMTGSLFGDEAPPVFHDANEASLRAFLDAATRFYEAEPWTRTEGDRFLGVQIDDEPWFFVNVMGQIEENPGLSFFEDWLTVCRFIHNQPSGDFLNELATLLLGDDEMQVDPFEAAGAMEALSLDERDLLHPADAERLDALSIDPPVQGQYPVPRRFDANEGPVAPKFDLETYRLTIEALLIALDRRHATPVTSIKTSLEIDGTSVLLRYPSEGTERPYDGPPGYRLSVLGHDQDISSPSRLPSGTRLVIDAPATALFKDVAKAALQFHDQFYEFSLYDWNVCLWNDRDSRRNPSPRVADLPELEDMDVEIGGVTFQLSIDRPLDTAPDEIHVKRRSDA